MVIFHSYVKLPECPYFIDVHCIDPVKSSKKTAVNHWPNLTKKNKNNEKLPDMNHPYRPTPSPMLFGEDIGEGCFLKPKPVEKVVDPVELDSRPTL